MNNRIKALNVLNYKDTNSIPVVHFGFWHETLIKWAEEGHITMDEASSWRDGSPVDDNIGAKLGFDFNWYNCVHPNPLLSPGFTREILSTEPDGSRKVKNHLGVIELEKDGAGSIPAEIDHLLKTREDWEKHYKHRLVWDEKRVTDAVVNVNGVFKKYTEGGLDFLRQPELRDRPVGIHCGSLMGNLRNIIGVEGISYIYMDDEPLFREMVATIAELCYKNTKKMLEDGAVFDFAHFWEDICFKNGPLVIPSVFDEIVGPWYKKITDLVKEFGIEVVSLDCDGLIDSLIPTWLNNGVNTMFPIEVGTWDASIAPWREKYGKTIRGVGGMNKYVFSKDFAAIDVEIERLKKLIALGGYIPCPDHRIAPDAKWENVKYYCKRLREL